MAEDIMTNETQNDAFNPTPYEPEGEPKRKSKAGKIILAIVLVIALIIGGLFVYALNRPLSKIYLASKKLFKAESFSAQVTIAASADGDSAIMVDPGTMTLDVKCMYDLSEKNVTAEFTGGRIVTGDMNSNIPIRGYLSIAQGSGEIGIAINFLGQDMWSVSELPQEVLDDIFSGEVFSIDTILNLICDLAGAEYDDLFIESGKDSAVRNLAFKTLFGPFTSEALGVTCEKESGKATYSFRPNAEQTMYHLHDALSPMLTERSNKSMTDALSDKESLAELQKSLDMCNLSLTVSGGVLSGMQASVSSSSGLAEISIDISSIGETEFDISDMISSAHSQSAS